MRLVQLEQRSPEWFAWRSGGLGGSDAAAVFGMHRHLSTAELWQHKVGGTSHDRDSPAIARGRTLEPKARSRYADHLGRPVRELCCTHDELEWLRASLDGWCEEAGLPVELKAPRVSDHQTALAGRVPRNYLPQCLHILLVTGADAMDYASYCPERFSERDALAVVRVRRDPSLLRTLLDGEQRFWEAVRARMQPSRPPLLDLSRARIGAICRRERQPERTP
jgi:putative phage-type endonuclease